MRERTLIDVCKRCGGWLSIGSTIEEEDATEYATTVTLRVPLELDLGAYADPSVGGCRCDLPYPMWNRRPHAPMEPGKLAEYLRWLEWYEGNLAQRGVR
jgi:hypothetical protein